MTVLDAGDYNVNKDLARNISSNPFDTNAELAHIMYI